MNPLNDIINLLSEAMSQAEALDPEELLPADVLEAYETMTDHGLNVDLGETIIAGDYIQGHIDAIVDAIDQAQAMVLTVQQQLS